MYYMDHLTFKEILKRYLSGQASAEEKRIIDLWYDQMRNEEGASPASEEEIRFRNRSWHRISEHIRSQEKRFRIGAFTWHGFGVAAALLIVVVTYHSLSSVKPPLPIEREEVDAHSPVAFKEIANQETNRKLITLPDGSKVTLDPRTTIRYSSPFDGPERKVYLDGKAFFEVLPDKARPFKVYTQKIITRVLGTSFTVSAFHQDDEVTVSVSSGKVSVYTKEVTTTDDAASPVILTPNQAFTYNKEKNKGARGIVAQPRVLVSDEEVRRMRFEDAAPKVIFEAIEKVYGVDIVFDEKKFSTCRITTNISDGNILSRLHIICEVMNATYKISDGRIVIEGEGCQSTI